MKKTNITITLSDEQLLGLIKGEPLVIMTKDYEIFILDGGK